MGLGDIRRGISDTTIPKLAFRSFALIELVLIIWAFCLDLDFGFYVLAPCVGLFFVALFLCNIIDSYLDPSYPVIEDVPQVVRGHSSPMGGWDAALGGTGEEGGGIHRAGKLLQCQSVIIGGNVKIL